MPTFTSAINTQAKVLFPNPESGTKLSKQRVPRPRVQEHKLALEGEHPKRFIVLSIRVLARVKSFSKERLEAREEKLKVRSCKL